MLLCISAIQNDAERSMVESLYHQYYKFMLYLANEILHDPNQAEDAVSQAFVKIIDKFQKFSFEDCNKTKGLIGILVKDICYDMLRAEKRREYIPIEDYKIPENSENYPLDYILSQEDYNALLELLSGLSVKSGSILRLKYIYDYSDREIAEFLNISPENVRVRLHRAKSALLYALRERGTADEKCRDESSNF